MLYQKKSKQEQPTAPISEREVRQQLAQAAGSEYFSNRDPLYHVTEDFQNTFDAMGRRHAAALAGELVGGFSPAQAQPEQDGEKQPDPTRTDKLYETRDAEQQDFVRRFSETTFQRGTLAGAVMAGTGKMMLVSCLKRTVGQSQPIKMQQRRLFEGSSQHRNLPGHDPRSLVFNRGFADSAVGIVVDTISDARSTVDALADAAAGKSNMGREDGAQTLRKMYPFLDTSREKQLLVQYNEQLEACTDPTECAVLQHALVHTRALLTKKEQMKQQFISKLRLISDRAIEALSLFETPDFAEQLVQEVNSSDMEDELPPESPENGEESDAEDRTDPEPNR